MSDKIEIQGQARGFPITVTVDLTPENWMDADFLGGIFGQLDQWGFEKPAPVVVAAPAAAPAAARPGASAAAPAQSNSGGCPVHGMKQVGKGWKDIGWECKVWDENQQDWTREKPANMNDGSTRWYCKYKWK